MSKNNHSAIAQEIAYVVGEVNKLSEEEVRSLYGIDLLEDGKVFDPMYDQVFPSVGEWAEFNVEQDDIEYEERFHESYYDED